MSKPTTPSEPYDCPKPSGDAYCLRCGNVHDLEADCVEPTTPADEPEQPLCPDCGKVLKRFGRADWRCPDHGQKMLELVLMADATPTEPEQLAQRLDELGVPAMAETVRQLAPTEKPEHQELDGLFYAHASTCKKGNKCCYSPDNGSTQEFIAAIEAHYEMKFERALGPSDNMDIEVTDAIRRVWYGDTKGGTK